MNAVKRVKVLGDPRKVVREMEEARLWARRLLRRVRWLEREREGLLRAKVEAEEVSKELKPLVLEGRWLLEGVFNPHPNYEARETWFLRRQAWLKAMEEVLYAVPAGLKVDGEGYEVKVGGGSVQVRAAPLPRWEGKVKEGVDKEPGDKGLKPVVWVAPEGEVKEIVVSGERLFLNLGVECTPGTPMKLAHWNSGVWEALKTEERCDCGVGFNETGYCQFCGTRSRYWGRC